MSSVLETSPELDAETLRELTSTCWYLDFTILPCRVRATWIVYVSCATCGRGYILACTKHAEKMARGVRTKCTGCNVDALHYLSKEPL